MQYFITYVLGYRSDSGKKAELGTIVHKVMECLAGLKQSHQNPDNKKLLINDDALSKLEISRDTLFEDSFIPELTDLSYEFYTKDSKHTWTKRDYNEALKLVWKTLEYQDGQFDVRFRNIVDPEPHFDIPIEEDWAKFDYKLPNGKQIQGQLAIKGTIDLVTEVSPGVIEVIDYKTGKRLDWATGQTKTYDKLQNDPQLLLYHYAISKLYPNYDQAIMTIFYIRDGGPFSMCFDHEDQDKFLDKLRKRFLEVQQNDRPKPLSQDRSSWKCTRLCHFYKNKWEGTNKTMCHHVEDHIKKHGMDKTVKDLTRDGHSIGFYEAPG